jgi:GH15 family glucan-1,4-alpha-glucosidase
MREAERREQAALEYARNVHAKAQELEQKLVVTDNSRLSETKTRITTQADQLKAIIRRAREEGDIDTETEAQERLMQLSLEQQQVNSWLHYQQQQQAQAPVQQPAPVQQAAPARRQPSPKAEDWAGRNEWFGKDKAMTYAAWGIHSTMVEEEGFDPESDEYYTEIDNRIRQEFPHRFAPAQQTQQRQRQNVPAVAPATRSSGVSSARRSVKLTPSQVAIAKKLGVPLEEYAKYVKE